MRKSAVLAALAVTLTGCSSPHIDGEVVWSVDHELTDQQFAVTHAFSVAEQNDVVTIVGTQDNAVMVRTFDTQTGELVVEHGAGAPVACTALIHNVLCTPVDWTMPQTPFVIDPVNGDVHEYAMTVMTLGQYEGRDIIQRSTPTGFELVSMAPDESVSDLSRGGEIIAAIGASNQVHITDQDMFDGLVDSQVIQLGSVWGEVTPFPGAMPIADGFIMLEAGSEPNATRVSLIRSDGDLVNEWEVGASLHFTPAKDWTLAEVESFFNEAAELATAYDHVGIFKTGEVIGLNQVQTDSVAPAYAWVEGFDTSIGQTLEFSEVMGNTLVLWIVDYPYLSVSGRGDEVMASTFNLETGEKVVDGAKCQWTDSAYCFDGETMKRVDF